MLLQADRPLTRVTRGQMKVEKLDPLLKNKTGMTMLLTIASKTITRLPSNFQHSQEIFFRFGVIGQGNYSILQEAPCPLDFFRISVNERSQS